MLRILTLWTLFFAAITSTELAIGADDTPSSNSTPPSNYYVSDDIGVVLRSGPTNRYRVIGRINAGTPITILESDSANGSSRIQVADGDSGWIQSQYITDQPTAQAKYQQLLLENSNLKQQVEELTQDIADKGNVIELNNSLQQQLSKLENEADTLRQQASLHQDRFQKDVLYSGALVLLFGMFIGWILLRFSQKKRHSSGWR